MEAEPGFAILTTNQKEGLDTAFLRRIIARAIMRWVPPVVLVADLAGVCAQCGEAHPVRW